MIKLFVIATAILSGLTSMNNNSNINKNEINIVENTNKTQIKKAKSDTDLINELLETPISHLPKCPNNYFNLYQKYIFKFFEDENYSIHGYIHYYYQSNKYLSDGASRLILASYYVFQINKKTNEIKILYVGIGDGTEKTSTGDDLYNIGYSKVHSEISERNDSFDFIIGGLSCIVIKNKIDAQINLDDSFEDTFQLHRAYTNFYDLDDIEKLYPSVELYEDENKKTPYLNNKEFNIVEPGSDFYLDSYKHREKDEYYDFYISFNYAKIRNFSNEFTSENDGNRFDYNIEYYFYFKNEEDIIKSDIINDCYEDYISDPDHINYYDSLNFSMTSNYTSLYIGDVILINTDSDFTSYFNIDGYIADEIFDIVIQNDYERKELLSVSDFSYFTEKDYKAGPEIKGPEKLESKLETALTYDDIIENYYGYDKIDFNLLDVKIKNDSGYFNALDSQKFGNYKLTLSATDSDGNETERVVEIELIDDTEEYLPVIEGPRKIYKANNILLTIDDIKGLYSAQSFDGEILDVNVRNVSYVNNANKVGSYKLKVEATDSEDRTRELPVTVEVLEGCKDMWYLDPTEIHTTQHSALTIEQIMNEYEWYSGKEIFYYEVIDDTYSEMCDVPGTYKFEVEITNFEKQYVEEITINVEETATLVTPGDQGFVYWLGRFFNWLWNDVILFWNN